MKKGLILLMFGAAVLSLGISSCNKIDSLDNYKDVNVGQTATMPLNGEYWVKVDIGVIGATDTTWYADGLGWGWIRIQLYNTASNTKDSIWFSDPNGWWAVAKTACVPSETLIKASVPVDNMDPREAGQTVTFLGGKVFLKGTITPGGSVADSISISTKYSDNAAGYIFRYGGYRRTGFQEDEH